MLEPSIFNQSSIVGVELTTSTVASISPQKSSKLSPLENETEQRSEDFSAIRSETDKDLSTIEAIEQRSQSLTVMLPLIISYFAEVDIVTSKKLYVAYEEGYFFPQNSTANPQPRNFGEIHDGRFEYLSHVYATNDVVVIMSYTQWSINSLDSRNIFLQLAKSFEKEYDNWDHLQIGFVAINCWLPKSECRDASRGLGAFPRFVIYIPELRYHIWYNGPVTVTALRSEIARLLSPYTVLSSLSEFRSSLVTDSNAALVIIPSKSSLSSAEGQSTLLAHLLGTLYQLSLKMSPMVQSSPWSVPKITLVTNDSLTTHICSVDCGFDIATCHDLMEEHVAVLYRNQKPIRFIQLKDYYTLLNDLLNAVRLLFAPSILDRAWKNSEVSYLFMPGFVAMPSVTSRTSNTLDGVLKNKKDFTIVLNSNNRALINDFISVKNLIDRCRKHYKKLYCVSAIHNFDVQFERNSSVENRYCQLCSKHSNISKVLSLLDSESSDYNSYILMTLQKSFQKFCYSSLESLISGSEIISDDFNYQLSLSKLKTALLHSNTDSVVFDQAILISRCNHNRSMNLAIASQLHTCNPIYESCNLGEFSYLVIYDRLRNNRVFNYSVNTISDIILVITDLVKQSYNLLTTNFSQFLRPPSHFLHKRMGVAVLPHAQRKSYEYISKLEYGDVNTADNKGGTLAKLSPYCRSDDIWSGNNTNNCLVLHYNSWCGFCQTVLHVFHTVGSIMTSSFPNVTDFVKVNSGLEPVPTIHRVNKFPTIVFYPAAEFNQKEFILDDEGKVIQRVNRVKNFTYTYPEDIAITVPNLYGFVRLHSGVY
ncbi:uncharacterized protein LOC142339243 isoform X2 [Convolutriloba macropyga]|uniref:uncharacterized protein LOC142339243 isoform X2 n=1 Tax=Convolutriloba macropyga TaxID=536237 RepID=UPI003F524BEC